MLAKEKASITLRIRRDISDQVSRRAAELGISTNAYITMILAKELAKEKQN